MRAIQILSATVILSIAGTAIGGDAGTLDTVKIEQLTGLKGTMNAKDGVFKVSSPRTDVKVSVDGTTMPPFMGLTSWAAFMSDPKGGGAMVMGDLVLLQDEVNPVMSALFENKVAVTALHNHFFFDDPKIYFMHIGGTGAVDDLAFGIKKAFDKVKEIRATSPMPPTGFGGKPIPSLSSITSKSIEDVLGKGTSKDGMFKAVFALTTNMPCGCTVGQEMGVNTWAAFAGSDDNAIVDGDFAVHEAELLPVLKALRAGGINIVAIHHHMIEEAPRIIFLHYWGKGDAVGLAKVIKSAVDLTSK